MRRSVGRKITAPIYAMALGARSTRGSARPIDVVAIGLDVAKHKSVNPHEARFALAHRPHGIRCEHTNAPAGGHAAADAGQGSACATSPGARETR
jgi:hypothetical protein